MSLDPILACAGRWTGRSTLEDPEFDVFEECASELTVTPVLGGRFVRLDYSWSYKDTAQEGSLLLGFDPAARQYSGHWADSWHMGHTVMTCAGNAGAEVGISIVGTYTVPDNPDWRWRIDVASPADHTLRLTMFNVSPAGVETRAVTGNYQRA
jgi:hypothetical protein